MAKIYGMIVEIRNLYTYFCIMLYFIKQLMSLFGALIHNNFAETPGGEIIDLSDSNEGAGSDVENLLSEETLTPEQTKVLAESHEKYEADQTQVIKETIQNKFELNKDIQLSDAQKYILEVDIDELSFAEIQTLQSILIQNGYDLWNYGPNKDGVDGFLGGKDSLTRTAYYDFLTRIEAKINEVAQPTESSQIEPREIWDGVSWEVVSKWQATHENVGDKNELSDAMKTILWFSIQRDKANTQAVRKLQNAILDEYPNADLGSAWVDGIWGPKTTEAFTAIYNRLSTEQYKKGSVEEVNTTIESAISSVKFLEASLKATNEINAQLSDIEYEKDEGYSIMKGLEKIIWKSDYDALAANFTEEQKAEMEKKGESFYELIHENEEKLESAIAFLSPAYRPNEEGYWDFDGNGINHQGEVLKDHLMKALPWLFGFYIWDVPLSFSKELFKGADINKSLAFQTWIKDWMPGEFEDFEGSNREVDVLQKQYSLRGILTNLHFDQSAIDALETGKLDELTNETKQLIKTYIEHRLLPDMRVLDAASFQWWDVLVDKKEDFSDELIEKVRELSQGEAIDFAIIEQAVSQFIDNVEAEWDVDDYHVAPVNERQEYFQEVGNQNRVFENIAWLIKNNFAESDLNVLFQNKDIQEFQDFGFSSQQKELILKAFQYVEQNDKQALGILLQETNVSELLEAFIVGDHAKNLLSQKPRSGEYERVQRSSIAAHGPNISGMTSQEVSENLLNTSVVDGEPSMWTVYESFVNKAAIMGLSYEEFNTLVAQGSFTELSSLPDLVQQAPIVNTGKKQTTDQVTTFADLAKEKGDTQVYEMRTEKSYTFYHEGKEITQTVEYTLYMRPDCSNPVIHYNMVNESVNQVTPEFNNTTFETTLGKFPVIIPWFVINKWVWSWGWGSSKGASSNTFSWNESDVWGGTGLLDDVVDTINSAWGGRI